MTFRLIIAAAALLLAGCEIPGLGPDPRTLAREADAKAIGSACRYGLRGIEDCYGRNESASKAAVFAGWKEMDTYMRENQVEGIRATDAPGAPEEVVLDEKSTSGGGKAKPAAEKSESKSGH